MIVDMLMLRATCWGVLEPIPRDLKLGADRRTTNWLIGYTDHNLGISTR